MISYYRLQLLENIFRRVSSIDKSNLSLVLILSFLAASNIERQTKFLLYVYLILESVSYSVCTR